MLILCLSVRWKSSATLKWNLTLVRFMTCQNGLENGAGEGAEKAGSVK